MIAPARGHAQLLFESNVWGRPGGNGQFEKRVMIKADLHIHSCFSHGVPTPFETHALATARGYEVIGFSEHSPRPLGYDYRREYRSQLEAGLQDYINQVLALKANAAGNPAACQVLFGMEMDWFASESGFVARACRSADFDYLLGSVHFLDHWGFDDSGSDWGDLSQEECEGIYNRYFETWSAMIASGLFDIAAHPDLIKIFSVERFHIWLAKPDSQARIRAALALLKTKGMAMEVSSAGLRKPCGEIYPHPVILQMARELDLAIAPASDSHALEQFGFGFDKLEKTVKEFGWSEQAIFNHGKMSLMPF